MDASEPTNFNKIPTASSKYEVPNCEKWNMNYDYSALNLLPDDSDSDRFNIACGACKAGTTAFSHANPNGFVYNAAIFFKGRECPVDGSYETTCTEMNLNSNKEYTFSQGGSLYG